MNYTEEIDYSSLSTYQLCPRKFFFQYVLNLRKTGRPSIDLIFGAAWHYALEKGYQALSETAELSPNDLTKVSVDAFNHHWKVEGEEHFDPEASYPKSPARAADMLNAYWQTFADEDRKLEIIGTEVPFSIALDKDLPKYVGRLDMAGLTKEGWLLIYEHKTAKFYNDVTQIGFENSLQAEGYLTAGHIYWENIPRVIYNVALCQKTKIDFFRQPVTKRDIVIDRFLVELRTWVERLLADLTIYQEVKFTSKEEPPEIFPRSNATTACTNYFRRCEYYDLCMYRVNPMEYADKLPEGFMISEWNPHEHVIQIRKKLGVSA